MRLRYFLLFIFILACKKELNITEFTDDFSYYEPELRIEALILPFDSTAIVRIDRSFLLSDSMPYLCIDNDYGNIPKDSCDIIKDAVWHGRANDITAYCGNWNPFIHDLGSDGIASADNNADGDYKDFGDIAPDGDGSENNRIPDCGEPNVDGYSEILPNVHNSSCVVSVIQITPNGISDSCGFVFQNNAGQFFNNKYTGDKSLPIFDNIENIHYGAYVPNDCNKEFWTDYSVKYSLSADCIESGFGVIHSDDPIILSRPVVFFNPEDIGSLIDCANYECLVTTSTLNLVDTMYFARDYPNSAILWSSIIPKVTYQVVQYMYDEANNEYKYFHGHAGFSSPEFQYNYVAISVESIVTEFYDGEGNGIWDDDEIYADSTQNGQWDEGEYFIDSTDDIPDVDSYYYEIFTFSDSYNSYYFNDQLYLDDVDRTNLRDENDNPILGAFGSMTANRLYFRIIDCTSLSSEACADTTITKSLCKWEDNITIQTCDNKKKVIKTYDNICFPSNYPPTQDCN